MLNNFRLKLKLQEASRSKVRFSKSEVEFESLPLTCRNREDVLSSKENINTVDKLYDRAVKLFGQNKCLGTRKVLRIWRVEQPDDSVMTKLDLVKNFYMIDLYLIEANHSNLSIVICFKSLAKYTQSDFWTGKCF